MTEPTSIADKYENMNAIHEQLTSMSLKIRQMVMHAGDEDEFKFKLTELANDVDDAIEMVGGDHGIIYRLEDEQDQEDLYTPRGAQQTATPSRTLTPEERRAQWRIDNKL